MPGEMRFSMREDKGKSSSKVWKAVGIGLAVGAVAVVGTTAYVANKLHTEDGLSGAALITATLAQIGGGALKDGGDGMVGGLTNLCMMAGAGVVAGAGASVLYDTIQDSTRSNGDDYLIEYI